MGEIWRYVCSIEQIKLNQPAAPPFWGQLNCQRSPIFVGLAIPTYAISMELHPVGSFRNIVLFSSLVPFG
jgi:hypothetical protein